MSTLTRRSLLPPVFAVPEETNFSNMVRRMFNEPFYTPMDTAFPWAPAVEIAETNDALLITAELPGLDERDLTISIENNVLTLSGKKEHEREDQAPAKAYHVTERFFGAFQRSFALPRTVDAEKVKAEFEKGILTITMPKLATAKGRMIPVTKK